MPDPDDDRLSMPLLPRDRTWQELRDENRRLKDEVRRLARELDALIAAVDRHVSVSVAEKYVNAPAWVIRGEDRPAYYTRAEAEAAYRKAAGLTPTEAPADAPGV